jgi:HlyD family secretion protein
MVTLGLAIVIFVTAGFSARAVAANTSSPAAVQVIRAANACFAAGIRISGLLVARQEARVSLDAPGFKVSEILANEGDHVTAGQVLARLTPLSGASPAAPPPATNPGPPGQSVPATLKAPAAGTVTRSTAAVGATAPPIPQEPLFRIAVDDQIELEGEVPSIYLPVLVVGNTVRVEMESRELSGKVRLLPAAIDQLAQLGRVRISVERDPDLRVGMFVRATIEADRRCGISVPRSALIYRTEGASVQVVRGDVIETRLVQVGLHSDTDVEVRNGLSEGDLVVANAGGSFRDGDKVTPVTADTPIPVR